HPVQPSNPRRLVLFWCIGAAALLCTLTLSELLYEVWAFGQSMAWTGARGSGNFGSNLGRYFYIYKLTWSNPRWGYSISHPLTNAMNILFPLAWPVLTLLSILIFRQTMRRIRVSPVHML